MRFKKTTLSNGLRLVTVPMPDNPSVTVLVMVEAGSKYETKDLNGLSHFLEHMVFKGTTKRPKASDISRELDSIGAHYNAFTSQEFTGYYAKADSRHFEAILDIVSDMYLDPLFEGSEIAKEKGVIVEEIKMYRDMPQSRVHDLFMSLLYGDKPAGWDIAGTEANVRSFTKDDLRRYRGQHYVASATTVIIGGSFDEAEAAKAVEEAFAKISSGKKSGKPSTVEEQSEPAIMTEFKETDQTHLVIGARSFAVKDPRMPAMMVLSTILGRGMSSRLFSKMRDELGICYYIKCDQDSYTDHGVLTISAGVDNSRVSEGIKGILGECERMKSEPVSDAELKKAKDYIAGTTMLELETSDARAEFCGYQETMKHEIQSPEEIIAKTAAVTAADVQKLAQDVFVNKGLNLAIIGRFKDAEAFKPYFRFV
ncbi:insulinase family protein [Patescibacteria group bacterium]|nr:insulinase family protein [Patescibacteria group bacterium]MDE1940841.1 insulinase family protein [Patescibacteria group bacterium]